MTDEKQRWRVSEAELKLYRKRLQHDSKGCCSCIGCRLVEDYCDAREIITERETRVAELEESTKLTVGIFKTEREIIELKYNALRAEILSLSFISGENEGLSIVDTVAFTKIRDSLLTPEPANESGGGADGNRDSGSSSDSTDRPAALGQRVWSYKGGWYIDGAIPEYSEQITEAHELYPICRHYEQTHDVKPGEYTVVECDTCRRTDTGKPGGRVIYHLTREECDNWQNFPLKSIKCPNCNGTGHTLEYVEQEKGE